MATTSGPLLSDHVNYLIFRYLQECGHEATARSFYNDWHRPREYRDPEELPFAGHVRRSALISVIQDGIRYDELQGRVASDAQRRHVWSQLSARHPFSQVKSVLPNGGESTQGGKRKSTSAAGVSHHFDDAQQPVPKRQRTAVAVENTRINGHRDAMEIDEHSASAAEDDEDGEAVSPALASETDLPATRYDSVATQTDTLAPRKPSRTLTARSLRFSVDKQKSKLFHASWNPSKHIKDRRTLITAGEGLCRLYKIPEHLDENLTAIPHTDEPSIASNNMITAITWHPSGRMVTCAVDSIGLKDGLGRDVVKRTLIDIGPDVGGTVSHLEEHSLLQPPGVVLRVEYSPSGEHLLVASSNLKRGLVEVWATPSDGVATLPRTDPIAWCLFEQELTDVAWCEDLQIRACTASSKSSILMLPESFEQPADFTSETIRRYNFIEEVLTLPIGPTDTSVMCRYDNTHWLDLYFVQSSGEQTTDKMIVLDLKHHGASNDTGKQLIFELQQDFITAALQPAHRAEDTNGEVKKPSSGTRLLAVAFESGTCQVFELGRSNDVMTCKLLTAASDHSLKMSRGPILAAEWSPDGSHLALAGHDQVQVWSAEREETGLLDDRPVLTWRMDDQTNGAEHTNGTPHTAEKHVCLTWDALGEKLCFVVDDMVVIVELRQPATLDQKIEMNGV